jgi:hypothetical protein
MAQSNDNKSNTVILVALITGVCALCGTIVTAIGAPITLKLLNNPTITSTHSIPSDLPITSTSVPAVIVVTATLLCDAAEFIDETIKDGTPIEANTRFAKTWIIKNTGTCTWTPDYDIVFFSGDKLGTLPTYSMPGYISPGQTINIIIDDFVSPGYPGVFESYWKLRNQSGMEFGFGSQTRATIWVKIVVLPPTATYTPTRLPSKTPTRPPTSTPPQTATP